MPLTAAITGFHMSQLFGPMLSPGSFNMKGGGVGRVVGRAPHLLHPVDAGAEGTVPDAREHDTSGVVVPAQTPPAVPELALHQRVERVQRLRPVERDPGDAVAFLVQDRLVLGEGTHVEGRAYRWRRAMPGFTVLKTYLWSVWPMSAGSQRWGLPSLSVAKNCSPSSHGR